MSSNPHSGGSGVHQGAERCQDGSHCHSGYVDPAGDFVLVSDLGQDKIYSYAIDGASGSLSEHSTLATAPGAGPRHMVFHPSGDWVYGINELDCTVSAYPYAAGTLGEPQGTITTLPAGYNNQDHANAKNAEGNPASGPNRPDDQTNACADIHVTPDGKFLYGSNRGHDSIVCYEIGGGGGELTFVGFTPTYGEHPRNFVSPAAPFASSFEASKKRLCTRASIQTASGCWSRTRTAPTWWCLRSTARRAR